MATSAMGTVDKALSMLRLFSVQTPELGLSELARLSNHDKATTLRCLTALERHGFVEQDTDSRKYRLGLAPINLARIREESFPVQDVLRRYLDWLSAETGETAHASLLTGGTLVTAMISEPDRALRVNVDPSGALPLHATASGIAILAFMPDTQRAEMLADIAFESYTATTPKDTATLTGLLEATRRSGLARADQSYEDEVIGTAVPIFGPAGKPIGSVAVAAVSLRMTAELEHRIETALRTAGAAIARELGGSRPPIPANIGEPVLRGQSKETAP